jgi:hypothetical protein
MRAIADAIGDPAIERVTVLKSARVGFSTVLTGAIGYHVVEDPCPVLPRDGEGRPGHRPSTWPAPPQGRPPSGFPAPAAARGPRRRACQVLAGAVSTCSYWKN